MVENGRSMKVEINRTYCIIRDFAQHQTLHNGRGGAVSVYYIKNRPVIVTRVGFAVL